ncbi:hypothetical protein [Persicobacter sp. CCB-QB2]|uniref:hypothetical protein n=1 Tax=Persicobacter sp. CCB-QB2 TaxID=1561025 RepID=UPI0006A9897F|nr:hypothetical protein [Persicobacter sp. CCB-QB2]
MMKKLSILSLLLVLVGFSACHWEEPISGAIITGVDYNIQDGLILQEGEDVPGLRVNIQTEMGLELLFVQVNKIDDNRDRSLYHIELTNASDGDLINFGLKKYTSTRLFNPGLIGERDLTMNIRNIVAQKCVLYQQAQTEYAIDMMVRDQGGVETTETLYVTVMP